MAMICELPYHTAKSSLGAGMFNTAMGKLQRQLHKGEYDIFKNAPIFESDFIQITKRGEVIDVHNRVRMVTVGIASTNPLLSMPDVMLLARPATGFEDYAGRNQAKGKGRKGAKALELTRLLPLKFVRISIHDQVKQQLRLKFATGRSCYLQLCSAPDTKDNLFAHWEKLTNLLRPPMESNNSTYALPAGDLMRLPMLKEEKVGARKAENQGQGDQDQVSIKSIQGTPEVAGATSAAFAGGQSIPQDTPRPTHRYYVRNSNTNLTELCKDSAAGSVREVVLAGEALDRMSVETTKGPGGHRSSTASAGAAHIPLKSWKEALAEVTQAPEAIVEVLAEARSGREGEGGGYSMLPQEEQGSEEEGRQRGPLGTGPCEGRRERWESREKERTLRSRRRRTAESHRKTGEEKALRKLPGARPNQRVSRDDKKERGRSSPGGTRRSTAHKGIAKEARGPHKPSRNLSTSSSTSTTKRLGRVGSFLRNVRANLTAKAPATQRGREALLAQPAGQHSPEAITKTVERDQGCQAMGTMPSESMDTVASEFY